MISAKLCSKEEIKELFTRHEIGEAAEPVEHRSQPDAGDCAVEQCLRGICALIDEEKDRCAVLIPERIEQRKQQRHADRADVKSRVSASIPHQEIGHRTDQGDAEQQRFQTEDRDACRKHQRDGHGSRIHRIKCAHLSTPFARMSGQASFIDAAGV